MKLFKEVCAVIDAQGYTIDGVFYPKEVALVSHKMRISVLCDIHLTRDKLTDKDRKTADWVYKTIGLPLESKDDYWRFASDGKYTQVFSGIDTVLAMYQWIKTDEKKYVAIKNPQLADILLMWDIPFINFPEKSGKMDRHVFQILTQNTCPYHKWGQAKCAMSKADALWNIILFTNMKSYD